MARTHLSGPLDIYGSSGNDYNNMAGPSTVSQWFALRDPRAAYYPGMAAGPNAVIGGGPFCVADVIPPTLGAAVIAAAATGASGTAMTLVSASGSGVYVNLPLVPADKNISAANVVRVLALGPGHTTGDTTATSKTIANLGSTVMIMPGAFICVPDGAAAGTPYIGQVVSKTTTTLVMATAVPASVTGAAIFLMDPKGITVDCTVPWNGATYFDPVSGVGRGVSVTNNNAGDTGWTLNVVGYDVYRVKTTIGQAVTANSVAYSTKTLKFIASATPSKTGSTTGTLSVGTADVFGIALRSSLAEHLRVWWGGSLMTSTTGFTPADGTSPATASTGDVRGTIQTGAAGAGSGIGSNASNGTRRLVIYQNVAPGRLLSGTSVDLYGVTQV